MMEVLVVVELGDWAEEMVCGGATWILNWGNMTLMRSNWDCCWEIVVRIEFAAMVRDALDSDDIAVKLIGSYWLGLEILG